MTDQLLEIIMDGGNSFLSKLKKLTYFIKYHKACAIYHLNLIFNHGISIHITYKNNKLTTLLFDTHTHAHCIYIYMSTVLCQYDVSSFGHYYVLKPHNWLSFSFTCFFICMCVFFPYWRSLSRMKPGTKKYLHFAVIEIHPTR